MNFKRIGRILVCLLLICCLTFHAMIPRAEASSIGAAATIVKASTVTCNPYIIAGATLIALGVYAGVETGAFETVANNCVDALEAAGTWIKDGAMELLRTEDADGNASYYVDSGLMEDVRSYLFGSGAVSQSVSVTSASFSIGSSSYSFSASQPMELAFFWRTGYAWYAGYVPVAYCLKNSVVDPMVSVEGELRGGSYYGDYYVVQLTSGSSGTVFDSSHPATSLRVIHDDNGRTSWDTVFSSYFGAAPSPFYTSFDVSLGSLPFQSSNLTDGTSARAWSEPYTDRGLKVYGGGSGNNNNDGKWFWPVVLVAGADLLAMSQADAWAGETPQEFDDYTTVEELEIVSRPEVDFAQGVELAPVTSPAPDTGGDTGSDNGTDIGNQTDYTSWFQKFCTTKNSILLRSFSQRIY